jgi:hypothetical protein
MSFEEGVFTLDDGRIQVRFKFQYNETAYQDALVFTQAEYAALEPGALDILKFERFNNWIISYEAAANSSFEAPTEA